MVIASFVIAVVFSFMMFILRCRSMKSMRDFTEFKSRDDELNLSRRVGSASDFAGRTPRVDSKIAMRDHRLEKKKINVADENESNSP